MNEQQINEYLNFLNEVLWVVSHSKADHKIVYPLLQANLNKLDNNFLYVWQTATTATLSQADLEQKQRIAGAIFQFSNLIVQFPLGSQAINIEISIVGYKNASTVFIRERFPNDWAMLQMNLGNAYSKRIWGERAENLEQAIYCHNMALGECSSDQFPERWVMLQNSMANAYRDRIRGERAENLEQAIRCYNIALKKCPRDQFREQWALLLYNLGIAYQNRIKGKRAENLEAATAFHQAALEVYTREAFRQKWAMVQHSLGNTLLLRIWGNRAENIEEAIIAFQLALQVYTFAEFPSDWAATIASLGTAYYLRIKGDIVNNCEEAISYYNLALQIYTHGAFPDHWAKSQLNLGNVYSDRNLGNRHENLKLAIVAYELALQVYTREAFPQEWAMTQSNLGSVYNHVQTERAENLEKAIGCYENALQIRTYEAFPQEWAETQINLASAYGQRLQGEKAENLQMAISYCHNAMIVCSREAFPYQWALIHNGLGNAYKERQQIPEAIDYSQLALEIFTPTTFPMDCIRVGRLLGDAAFTDRRWDEAIKGYAEVMDAVEQSRTWMTSDLHRQAIQKTFLHLYEKMVQACISAGQLDKAIETVERSRSKRLIDLMASNDLYSSDEIPPKVKELLEEYESLQKQIDYERFGNNSDSKRGLIEAGSRNRDRAAFQAYNEAIAILETQKDQVFEQIRGLDPVLAGGIQVSALEFAKMQKLIDRPTTAILSFYTTTDNTYIFVVRQNQSTPDLHTCMGEGIEILQNWIEQNWLQPYLNDKGTWQSQLNDFLAELAQRLQINNLIDQHLQGIEELILVPHLLLHQIPLAALPIQDTEHSYLGDKFLIRYAPSCQVLEFCQERENRHPIGDSLNYGIVEDATEDLACASFEAEQITNLFNIPESQRLSRSQATKSNYRQLASQVQLLHSCHHAQSRLDKPLESILQLANETLTLGELLTPGWRLPNLWDVFLSCCETNLGVPESLADEILTLSTGFLCAGARSVISTLWSVNDLATALFSIFYYQERQQGKSRPEALQQAQKKLRSLTQEDIKPLSLEVQAKRQAARKQRNQYPPSSADYLKWDGEYRKYAGVTVQIDKVRTSLEDEPFSHPRYWAAFTCSGLR